MQRRSISLILKTKTKISTSFFSFSSVSFFSLASRYISLNVSYQRKDVCKIKIDLGFLLLQFLTGFTLLNDPLMNLVNAFTRAGLVLQQITLKTCDLEAHNGSSGIAENWHRDNPHSIHLPESPQRNVLQAQKFLLHSVEEWHALKLCALSQVNSSEMRLEELEFQQQLTACTGRNI